MPQHTIFLSALMEGHAAAGYAELFLHGILTLTAATPHSFDETRLVVIKIFHLFFVVSLIGMAVTMFLCFLEKVMLDAGQDLRKFGSQLVNGDGDLLSGISSYYYRLTCRTSLGPSSPPGGIPLISCSENFQPGLFSESSIFARMPAAREASYLSVLSKPLFSAGWELPSPAPELPSAEAPDRCCRRVP